MAVNEARNLGDDLRAGITDGSVKKVAPDRGGIVEENPHNETLLQEQYGAVKYGSSFEEDKAASRVHDSQYFGEAEQDTTFTWYKTCDLGHTVSQNIPHVTTPS